MSEERSDKSQVASASFPKKTIDAIDTYGTHRGLTRSGVIRRGVISFLRFMRDAEIEVTILDDEENNVLSRIQMLARKNGMSIVQYVAGRCCLKLPILRMSVSPARACMTLPAARKRSALKKA